NDAFAMKFNGTNGNIMWVTQLGDTTAGGGTGGDNDSYDYIQGVAVDAADNVYMCGETGGSMGETNGGQNDIIVIKLDSDGVFQYVTQFGEFTKGGLNNIGRAWAYDIAVHGTDIFLGAGNDDDGMDEPVQGWYSDVVVIKLDGTDGSLTWMTQLGTVTRPNTDFNNGGEVCKGIAVDSDGDVYCSGYTHGNLGEFNIQTGRYDAFILKLDGDNGNVDWITQLGDTTTVGDNSGRDQCYAIALGENNDVYCAGDTDGDLGSGDGEAFVMRLNADDGELQWVTQYGGYNTADTTRDNDEYCRGLDIDSNGDIFCVGRVSGTGLFIEDNNARVSGFVIKLNKDGTINDNSIYVEDL
ncbi:SBBP repeat-containing protein, partial [Bacteriovoracaceae bacterium]|nr:SBBP repeat-containing protein [Bacteriovoracaceae bacterium]